MFGVRVRPRYFGFQAIPAGGVTVLLGGLSVNGVVANMVGLCAFMDLGDTVMYGGRFVVPLGRRPMCRFSAFMRFEGALAGEFNVLSADSLAVLEFDAAAREFVSSRGGSVDG